MAYWGTMGLESQVKEMKSAQCGRIFGRRRHFIWKCFHGIVSVKEVLFKRELTWRAETRMIFLEAQKSLAKVAAERGPDPPSAVQRWSLQVGGVIKFNFDAGLDIRSRQGGVGLVGRDSSGRFVAARCLALSGITTPLVAEALAAREGLVLASTLGVTRVQFEGDSLNLIRMIRGELAVQRDIEVIMEDIRRLACDFRVCEFSFVKRTGIGVTHCLSSRGYGCVGVSTWEAYPPDWLSTLLSKDEYAL
ncbi:hypothetical protein RHMOL_Rhmol11G0074900 [Rhododendron molle]|uniref:Uncharacterized protein n=1 Tax=Rhododendron molle TaxID=49168 RepID=A0ACC0LPJ4_RHOML|nr:hypothetical protein RHMOL_Rhmol11G0074900 [Rhododendron molle]